MSAMNSTSFLVSSSPSSFKRRLSDRPPHPVLVNLPYPASSPASPQKTHLHLRSASGFASAIRAWAEQVAPGSPNSPSKASPNSRRLSFTTTASISLTSSPRRPSEIIVPSPHPTASILGLQKTPSSGAQQQHFDLTALGYTTHFVYLPNTPETPEEFLELSKKHNPPPPPSTPKSASAGIRSFKSFFVGRGRSKSQSGGSDIQQLDTSIPPPVPAMPEQYKSSTNTTTTAPKKTGGITSLFPSRSKSTQPKPSKPVMDPAEREARRAAALQQHVNMATFIAGGKPSHHAHDIAKDYAKRTGQPVSMPVKIDGQYYFGRDERDEYKGLLKKDDDEYSRSSASVYHHGAGRRASTTSSLGPLVRESEAPTVSVPFPPPQPGHSSSSSSSATMGKSKGKHIPPSLPLQHSNFSSKRRHAFDDSFAPSVRS